MLNVAGDACSVKPTGLRTILRTNLISVVNDDAKMKLLVMDFKNDQSALYQAMKAAVAEAHCRISKVAKATSSDSEASQDEKMQLLRRHQAQYEKKQKKRARYASSDEDLESEGSF
jgi:hypothetical protein